MVILTRATNAEDVKVGPLALPLPWLIIICIFAPCLLGFVIFFIHQCAIGYYQNRRARLEEEAQRAKEEGVEMTVRAGRNEQGIVT
jgi:hypothetical protein